MAKSNNNVGVTGNAYDEMAVWWPLPDALISGSQAMRDAGKKYLPKEPKESVPAYDNRKSRSHLYSAYADTMDQIVGKPFSRPTTIKDEDKLSEELQRMIADTDREGTDFHGMLREALRVGANRGLVHFFVDYPAVEEGATLATERALDIRPSVKVIDPIDLLGWQYGEDAAGNKFLVQVRFREMLDVAKGKYGDEKIERITVFTPTTFEIWEKSAGTRKAFKQIVEGTHTFGRIPLETVYINKKGFMRATPPLYNLAELNLAHWQSDSDQANILRFYRIGILFGKGFSKAEQKTGITIGADTAVLTESEVADLKIVEGTGAAIGAGRTHGLDLQEQMIVQGAQPFIARTGRATATEHAINEAGSNSDILSWIRVLEVGGLNVLNTAAEWMGQEVPDTVAVDIFSDFSVTMKVAEEVRNLILARQTGEISRERLLTELKRRSVLSEDMDIQAEIEAANAESASSFGGDGDE